MKVGLAILNRNEQEALTQILPQLPLNSVDGVFAVDGNSSDGSVALLQAHGIEVLPQHSGGRGEAFRIAFNHARHKMDAVILYGPDGNEAAQDIPKFRTHLEQGADMVVASRMLPLARNEEDDALWRPRKWANQAFALAAYGIWGRGRPRLTDPINGFRAVTVAAWDRLAADGNGYTIEYQCSIRAYKLGLNVQEFPTMEGPRLGGQSQAYAIPTGLRFLKVLLREALLDTRKVS